MNLLTIAFKTLLWIAGIPVYREAQQPIAAYSDSSTRLSVYQGSFDGICYLKLINSSAHYVVICELNKHKNIFIWKTIGKESIIEYSAVINGATRQYPCADTSVDNRIYVTPAEIKLLKTAIQNSSFPEAKRYTFDLGSIAYFSKCY